MSKNKSTELKTTEENILAKVNELQSKLDDAKPMERRYHTQDSTYAKLGDLLVNNEVGLLVFRDEISGLLSRLDDPKNEEERAFYLEGYNGKQGFHIDRIERGENYIPNVCLSVLGGTQPDKLGGQMIRAFKQSGNDGFLQRFGMLVYPEQVEWRYIDQFSDKVARDRAWKVFQELNDFDPEKWGAMPPDDFCRFFRFRFSGKAQELFIKWQTWLQCEILKNEENPRLEEHFAKYEKLIPALSLIFHLVDISAGGNPGPITDQAFYRAAAWSELLMEHARKAYGLLMDADLEASVALSEKIKSGSVKSGFSARDVHRNKWSKLTDIGTVKEAIEILVHENWLRPMPIKTGGRPKEGFAINPKIGA